MFLLNQNEVLKEKFRTVFKRFIYQTAAIYGGEKGLYDYGPAASDMMDNIIDEWKKFFVVQEQMLKVKCTMVTPEKVLKASGHVDRFNDWLVSDSVTKESFRADHLIESALEIIVKNKLTSEELSNEITNILQKMDNFGGAELDELIKRFNIKSSLENDLTEPRPFNLMFPVSIGPSGDVKGYLRPETAQGIFINFKNFMEEKHNKLPFAVAQIGSSFRNEIAPRSGLLRVREFEMAEIEHFLDPLDKSHAKFKSVSHLNIFMFPSNDQLSGKSVSLINLGEAVTKKLVNNETLGYFIGRIYLYLTKIGIKHELLRFRQHMPNEMAHYASDCWDAECLTSYGWIECVGCADRGCYDLDMHSKESGVKLVAQRQLSTPKIEKRLYCKPNMKVLGGTFKKDGLKVANYLQTLPVEEGQLLLENGASVTIEDKTFALSKNMGDIIDEEVTVHFEDYIPTVIEPSFGLGRIFYSLMEQNFAVRDNDIERTYFTVPPRIAACKFSILPLSSKDIFEPLTSKINSMLIDLNIVCAVDYGSASIGKRYARTDMMGVPYGITVDFDSVNIVPASVTVRERDSMSQIRVPIDELPMLALSLVNEGHTGWKKASATYPLFKEQLQK